MFSICFSNGAEGRNHSTRSFRNATFDSVLPDTITNLRDLLQKPRRGARECVRGGIFTNEVSEKEIADVCNGAQGWKVGEPPTAVLTTEFEAYPEPKRLTSIELERQVIVHGSSTAAAMHIGTSEAFVRQNIRTIQARQAIKRQQKRKQAHQKTSAR